MYTEYERDERRGYIKTIVLYVTMTGVWVSLGVNVVMYTHHPVHNLPWLIPLMICIVIMSGFNATEVRDASRSLRRIKNRAVARKNALTSQE